MKPSKHGMVIAIVVMLMTVLMIFIFSYSRMLSTHNLQLKRVQMGAMAAHLAVGAANVVAGVMEKETGSIYSELSEGYLSRFSYLLDLRVPMGESVDIPIPNPDQTRYEALVRGMIEDARPGGIDFKFDGLNVFFQDVSGIVISQDPFFTYRDMVEKQGFLTIEVRVSSIGQFKITKVARIKRPFKVVNLLAPILSRFCLFVAHTPHAETYNVVNYQADGTMAPRPLLIRSGPIPIAYSEPPVFPPDALELQLNGWIYLGPTNETPNDNVYLNMAYGYTGPAAQMMLFGRDPSDFITRFSMRNPPGLRHWFSDDPALVMFFFRFEGIRTDRQNQYNSSGVFGYDINPLVSWLMPYGNTQALSRTLVAGPVFGRVLKKMEMGPYGWEPDGADGVKPLPNDTDATMRAWNNKTPVPATPPSFSDNLPTQIHELFRRAQRAGADTSQAPEKWSDVFTSPQRYNDYASREVYIPYNQFFDLVKYPLPPNPAMPSWYYLPIDPNDSRYITPGSVRGLIQMVSPSSVAALQNAYVARDMLTFGYTQGPDRDFFIFAGDLNRFKTNDVVPLLFETRATKKFVLGGPAGELQAFKDQILIQEKIIDMPGIILINRDPSEANLGPLELPSDLVVKSNAVLVIDRGDLAIDGITSLSRDIHLTIVLLSGSFRLTSKLVQAHLIALKPATSYLPSGGHLSSLDGGELNIDGAVAVQTLGIPETGNWSNYFRQGGVIQYNHTLNPCNYWYEDYYGLFLSDASPNIEVKEN